MFSMKKLFSRRKTNLSRRISDATTSRRLPLQNSLATLLPNEIIEDVFRFLDRDELEKCELVCLRWHYYVEDSGSYLAYRLLDSLEFEDNGSIRFPENMRGIDLDDIAKVLRFCCVKHCQIAFFNEGVYRAFRELKERMRKPMIVGYINDHRDFAYCFQLLDMTVRELVKSAQTRIIFCAYQLAYLVSRPSLLNIPKPTKIILEVDNGQSIYETDIQSILKYVFHTSLTNASHRCSFILDSLNVGGDFVQQFVEKFLAYPRPDAMFRVIEILPRRPTVVYGKRYLKLMCKRLDGKIDTDHDAWLDYTNPYVVERPDGWCLLICLQNVPDAVIEGEEYALTFFVKEKPGLKGLKSTS